MFGLFPATIRSYLQLYAAICSHMQLDAAMWRYLQGLECFKPHCHIVTLAKDAWVCNQREQLPTSTCKGTAANFVEKSMNTVTKYLPPVVANSRVPFPGCKLTRPVANSRVRLQTGRIAPCPPPRPRLRTAPAWGGVCGVISIFILISIWILIFISLLIWIDNIGIHKSYVRRPADFWFCFSDVHFWKKGKCFSTVDIFCKYLCIIRNSCQYLSICGTEYVPTYILFWARGPKHIYCCTYIYIYIYMHV